MCRALLFTEFLILGLVFFGLDLKGYELSVTKFEFPAITVKQSAWDICRFHWRKIDLNLHNVIRVTSLKLKLLCHLTFRDSNVVCKTAHSRFLDYNSFHVT
jgi:hypothetical protein